MFFQIHIQMILDEFRSRPIQFIVTLVLVSRPIACEFQWAYSYAIFIVAPSPSLNPPFPRQQSEGALDSSGTLVEESTQTGDSNCYTINRVPLESELGNAVPQQTTKPARGAASSLAPASGRKDKFRGVPVAPLKLDEDKPFSRAFTSPSRTVSSSYSKVPLSLVNFPFSLVHVAL